MTARPKCKRCGLEDGTCICAHIPRFNLKKLGADSRVIQDYIEEERERCATLVELLPGEAEFLLYCIRAPVYPNEIDEQRKRFSEYQDPDNFEDLM